MPRTRYEPILRYKVWRLMPSIRAACEMLPRLATRAYSIASFSKVCRFFPLVAMVLAAADWAAVGDVSSVADSVNSCCKSSGKCCQSIWVSCGSSMALAVRNTLASWR